jgi:hypothetical protein
MNRRLVRRSIVVLTAWLGVAALVGAPTGGGTAPAPPAPSQSLFPSPSPSRDPCNDGVVSIDDFVMWDSVEGGVAEIPVHSRVPCPEARTIVYSTFDGTARAGQDYVGVQRGTFQFPAGTTRTTLKIKILGDQIVEPTEYFGIRLLAGARFSDPTSIVTLRDR